MTEEHFLSEMEGHRDELARIEADESTFANTLIRMQLEDRVRFLEEQVEGARLPQLDVVLAAEAGEEHAVPAAILAGVIGGIQKAITWGAYALRFGPGVEREPPAALQHATEVNVHALVPGSFTVSLRPRKTGGEEEAQTELQIRDESLLERSVSMFLDLAEAAESGAFAEEVEGLAQNLGPKASRQVQRVMDRLADSGGRTAFLWKSVRPREVELRPEAAKALKAWLAEVESSTDETDVRGTLLMADVERGRFKIQDSAGNVFEGKPRQN